MISSKEAAQLFLERVFVDGYQATCSDLENSLTVGLPGEADDPVETEKWFSNLNPEDKQIVKEIIRATAKMAIFNMLVTLDNVSGGPPIRTQVSDFALSVQTYHDDEEKLNNQADQVIRINSLKDENFHDLFLDRVNEIS